jgi:hypothetical protein
MLCSRRAIATGRLPVELLCLSTMILPRVFDLVFCKALFGNKYYIYSDIGYFVSFFCTVCV